MNILFTILATIIIYQIIMAIIIFVSDENEELIYWCCGFVGCVFALVFILITRKIYSFYVRKNYNLYLFWSNGYHQHNSRMMKPKTAEIFNIVEKDEVQPEGYFVTLEKTDKDFPKDFNAFNYKKVILTKRMIEKGFDNVSNHYSKEFFDKFKKRG